MDKRPVITAVNFSSSTVEECTNKDAKMTHGSPITRLYSLSNSFAESNSTGGPLFLGFFETLAPTCSETEVYGVMSREEMRLT
jgi:hypothetical protein